MTQYVTPKPPGLCYFVLAAIGNEHGAFCGCELFHPGPFGLSEFILEMCIFHSCLESQLMDHEYKLSWFMLYIFVFEPNIVSPLYYSPVWVWEALTISESEVILFYYIFLLLRQGV